MFRLVPGGPPVAFGQPVGGVAGVFRPQPRAVAVTLDSATVERLPTSALSTSATAKLLAARRGGVVSRQEVARIQRLSGGNPLFALELGAAAATQQGQVPASLRRLVDDHLGALSPDERGLLLLAALTAQPTVSVLRAASADSAVAQRALDAVVGSGILIESGEQLSFAHPVLRSVIAESADPATRRGAHRRLAEVVDRPEARARHVALAAAGPDDIAAAAAEDAARIAAARGASDTAAELAAYAVRLTSAEGKQDTVRRTALLAEYRFHTADIVESEKLLANLTEQIDRGPQRAEVLMRLARCRAYLGQPLASWTATLNQALAEAAADSAADGHTNADIAAKLFMAQRTVEAHLSQVYRKLGVRSRTEMSHRLRRP
jgi:hypothetical protein